MRKIVRSWLCLALLAVLACVAQPARAGTPNDLRAPCGAGIAVSADGRRIAFDCDDHVEVADAATGRHVADWSVPAPTAFGRPLALSADGSRLALSLWNRLIVWEVPHGRLLADVPLPGAPVGLPALAFGGPPQWPAIWLSPSGASALVRSSDSRLTLINFGSPVVPLESGLRVPIGPGFEARNPFTPDGRTLVLWKEGRSPGLLGLEVRRGAVLWSQPAKIPNGAGSAFAVIAPDGLLFAQLASGAAILDPATGESTRTLPEKQFNYICFADSYRKSNRGGAAINYCGADEVFYSQESAPGKLVRAVPERGYLLGFSEDGDVVSSYNHRGIWFFDPSKGGGDFAYLPFDMDGVTVPSPDRARLVMTGREALIVDLKTREQIACWERDAGACAIARAKGEFASVAGSDKPSRIAAAAATLVTQLKANRKEQDRDYQPALIALGEALAELNDFDRARPVLLETAERYAGAPRAQALTVLGETYAREGRFATAEPILARAVEESETVVKAALAGGASDDLTLGEPLAANARAVAADARVLMQLSRPDAAAARLEAALGRHMHERELEAQLLDPLARIHEAKGEFAEAEALRLRAINNLTDAFVSRKSLPRVAAVERYGQNLILQSKAEAGAAQLQQALSLGAELDLPETSREMLNIRTELSQAELGALNRPTSALENLRISGKALVESGRQENADREAAKDRLDRSRAVFRLTVQAAWEASTMDAIPAASPPTPLPNPAPSPNPTPSYSAADLPTIWKQAVFLPGGKIAATGTGGEVIWSPAGGRREELHLSGWLAPAGGLLYGYDQHKEDYRNPRLGLLDAATGKPIAAFSSHPPAIFQSFSATGEFLIMAGDGPDGSSFPKSVPDVAVIVRAKDLAVVAQLPRTLTGANALRYLAMRPDGQTAVEIDANLTNGVGVEHLCRIALRPVSKLACAQIPHGEAPIVFSPDGRKILVPDWTDSLVQVYDVPSLTLTAQYPGHRDDVTSIVWSPDGSKILTTSKDWTAQIIDAASGKLLSRLLGHQGPVNGGGFSPDGAKVVTASSDGTVRVWSAVDGKALQVLR
jgi:tetratricopeptide (TPR) repeat protein